MTVLRGLKELIWPSMSPKCTYMEVFGVISRLKRRYSSIYEAKKVLRVSKQNGPKDEQNPFQDRLEAPEVPSGLARMESPDPRIDGAVCGQCRSTLGECRSTLLSGVDPALSISVDSASSNVDTSSFWYWCRSTPRPVTSHLTGGAPTDQPGHTTAGGDEGDEPLNREGIITTPPLRPERVYQPKVPYPNASKTSKKERERAKLRELIGQLTVRLPFVEACAMIPTLRKYMKSIMTNNISLEDGVMMITQDCSAILQNRSPQKRGDPGSFVLSCTIGEEVFERCLCDLGSSINMMPLSTAKHLGYHSFKPTKISLVLADRSVRRPIGVLLDIPITIGECQIPTDFVVLEVEKEPKDPLILGRPFLSTEGAIIDVPNGKIDLHLGDFVMKFDMNETLKQASSHNQVFSVDKVEEATSELCEEIILDDPMEIALMEAKDDYVFLMESVENSAKILDSAECYTRLVAYLDLDEESSKPAPPKDTPSAVADPWSELRALKVELKQLPVGLRHAFLGPNCTYPIIINSDLDSKETAMLLSELRKHRKALGYSLEDIPGISPDLYMHRIHLEEGAKNSIEHHRRLNPNLKDVVKKEIMKLLEAGIIYPISDSTWVSPVHVVPKKRGVTIIKSDNDELIATRTITGHRMCIDYRKLNAATRKDHFPLPFIDQMLERYQSIRTTRRRRLSPVPMERTRIEGYHSESTLGEERWNQEDTRPCWLSTFMTKSPEHSTKSSPKHSTKPHVSLDQASCNTESITRLGTQPSWSSTLSHLTPKSLDLRTRPHASESSQIRT
ncbi:hypothetical protein ISN44_As09g008770 [Arabidopsis suecica]|uniref:Uncharacterized protein n=1 Tax=Arabidopsis suecica TaxID=45249 RepID=A0A8T2AHR9_ARASU|nr:hypothetical protein ISN44_As09g008770 [Arabidopsis suecica]